MSKARNKKGKLIAFIMLIVTFAVYLFVAYIIFAPESEPDYGENGPPMKVHFIDVGQGDSTFIELPNGETMLIDAGEEDYAFEVAEYIKNLGYTEIDYCIGTHAHSDHIGGMDYVFERFEIKRSYTTEQKNDSTDYYEFVDAVEYEGIPLQIVSASDVIVKDENLKVEVVGPFEDELFEDLNDSSLVILVSYFDKDFLITGDAGHSVIDDYDIGDIEVLRVSHHGSYTGTSDRLLRRLTPEHAVISVGLGNRYRHPHTSVMQLFEKHDIKVYRTDKMGEVLAVCDKNTLTIE